MIELEGVPELIDPVMVAAFEGWNDAGDAASAAVVHLDREWKGEVFAALDAEDYYDFQVNRPTVFLEDGVRKITWPTTRLSVVRVGGEKPRDLVLVRGIEPSMRWRSFCNELLGFAHELGVEMIVILGALLGDTPHTRPVPVSGVTSDPQLARTMDLEETRYEGPTGIVGVLQEACTHAGVPAVSLWAAVPHYVSQPPNPKATLALLNRLEDLIGLRVPTGELVEDARAWQLGVDQLAAEDSEVAEYVQSLEEARDTAELPEASGEAIAREFERYLRRRDGRPGTAPGGHATETGSAPEGRDSGSYLRDPGAGTGRPAKPVTPEDTAGDAPGRPADGEGTDGGRGTAEGGPGRGDPGKDEAGEDGTGGRGTGKGRGGRSRPRGRGGAGRERTDREKDGDGDADGGPSGAGSGNSGGGNSGSGDGTEDGPGSEDE
ncbi:PAC2 family protein [Streptomyces sp. S07_1.15]|uniref:PAC2 family protein n=1 Tax=Streptomyces sp. S07_1.15 TaxID=2873925 RepID=UPI001D13644A|nr:PAC2 family protein [Streptomyces sp. S07_1.15]MCC3655055.1 PAC2 family protein [Streptomyces sp. S07_1.15]